VARFILCNRVPYDGLELKAGKEIDDTVHDVAKLIASGAILVAIPAPAVEARAVEVRQQEGKGRREAELDLLTAAFAEFALGASMTLNVRDEGVPVPNSPFAVVNFTGAGVSATDAGAGQVDVTIPGGAALSGAAPTTILPDDAPAPGVSTDASRADHRHGIAADVPVDVTKAANAEGVSTSFARADHKHDISTAAPSTTSSANAEGAASTLARSDHVHRGVVAVLEDGAAAGTRPAINFIGAAVTAVDNGGADRIDVTISAAALTAIAPTTIAPDDAPAVGVGTAAARDDHRHGIAADVAGAIAVGDSAAEGVSTSFARADHQHALAAPAAPANVTKAAASAGVATTVARADHKHDVTTAAPIAVGSANAEGTATSLARSDHVHVGDSAILLFGNDSVTSTTTTRYLTPCYEAATARTAPVQYRSPRAGILRNLRIRQNTGAGNGNSIVYTVRVNGVASALSVSMASTANDGGPDTDTVAVAAGDLIDIEVTKAASVATSPSDIVATMELAA
jgi:hypothetical protein